MAQIPRYVPNMLIMQLKLLSRTGTLNSIEKKWQKRSAT